MPGRLIGALSARGGAITGVSSAESVMVELSRMKSDHRPATAIILIHPDQLTAVRRCTHAIRQHYAATALWQFHEDAGLEPLNPRWVGGDSSSAGQALSQKQTEAANGTANGAADRRGDESAGESESQSVASDGPLISREELAMLLGGSSRE